MTSDIAKVWIESDRFGNFTIHNETGKSIYVQSDFEFGSLAINFGWLPCHNETDGSINCPICGKTTEVLINEAAEYLMSIEDKRFDDPGYFV